MQWNQISCPYLRRDIWEVQNLEETQEVRLPDGMPDIGRILCAWGQPVLRSKEWRGDTVGISGGISAWVLYMPEEATTPECMELWLPFQAKFSLPDSRREGVIRANCCLRSVDARTLSSRKMLVRASVGLLAEALEETDAMVYSPPENTDGIQLLCKKYPAVLPREAGEKLFTLEEGSVLSETPRKLLCCRVQPVITEQNVVGSRAVIRGKCRVQCVYMTEDGLLKSYQFDYPIAQYADLDREYDRDAEMSVMMSVSNLEPELLDGKLQIKCGLIAQYVILDRQMVEVAEDAYAPFRQITADTDSLELPMMLDKTTHTAPLAVQLSCQISQVVDISVHAEQSTQYREGQQLHGQLPGCVQMLYYDTAGQLQAGMESFMSQWSLPMEAGGTVYVSPISAHIQVQNVTADQVFVDGEITLEMLSVAQRGIPMITGLQLGELKQPDPERPSLILRRFGEESLWELAKCCGSTVENIQKANGLTDEPMPGQMLLIPVC